MRLKNPFGIKLIAAAVSLVGALALLGVGTFAWFTTSTEAENEGVSVSFVNDGSQWPFEVSKDKTHWEKELNISSLLSDALLRPISTADLQSWYVATYDSIGNVSGFREVNLKDVANKLDHSEDTIQNHVLYCDIYLRTRDPSTTYSLRLNNPATNADGSPMVDEGETVYGTYVLCTPQWDTTSGRYISDQHAMASIRVGLQCTKVEGENDTPVGDTTTLIYEPNADMHTGLGTVSSEMGNLTYILGIEKDKVSEYSHSGILTTLVPKSNASGYEMVSQPVSLIQKTSAWKNLQGLQQLSQWDSTQIQTIGKFVAADGSDIAVGNLPVLANEVKKNEIYKLRIYFWLEGQDVDCWNQVAGSSIYANLEFYGEAVNMAASSAE